VSRANLSRRWCREPGTLRVHLRLSFVLRVDISSRSAHVWAFRSFGRGHRSYKSGPFLLPGRCCWLRGSRFTGVERESEEGEREKGAKPYAGTQRLLLFLPTPLALSCLGLHLQTLLVSSVSARFYVSTWIILKSFKVQCQLYYPELRFGFGTTNFYRFGQTA